jgi:hypothetical protein
MMRKIGYVIVLACFASSLLALIPLNKEGWSTMRTVKVHKHTHPPYTREQVLKSVEERLVTLAKTHASLDVRTVHDNLIFVNQVRDFGPKEDHETDNAVTLLARTNMDMFEAKLAEKKLTREQLYNLQQSDPAWQALRKVDETTYHWDKIGEYAGKRLPFAGLLAFIGFMGLVELWGLSKVMRVAYFSLSFLLSASGGAIAQTVKKMANEGKGKTEVTRTMQADARVTLYEAGGPPTPGLFLRLTHSGKRTVFESVSTMNARTRAWSTDLLIGGWVPGTSKTKVLAGGYVAEAQGTNARIGAGLQVFRAGKRGLFALPVFRWERQLHGPPNHSFMAVLNPNIKLKGRWSVAPEALLRKVQGKPWAWQIGAGLRLSLSKGKFQAEQGWFSNQSGVGQLRNRFISTFAY